MIRIIVGDRYPAFQAGLRRILSDEDDIQLIGDPSDGHDVVRLSQETLPDVIVIDAGMRGLNGIEVTKKIKETRPTTTIIIMDDQASESRMLSSLREGAAAYLLKECPVTELVTSIRKVYAGDHIFNMGTVCNILYRVAKDLSGTGNVKLHHRELEILRLAAKGMHNREIAIKLNISERTVQSHLKTIFQILSVGSRTEAVIYALREGWFDIEDLAD